MFLDAVRAGTGVVVIHAANNNGNGWTEYERLVGDLWRKGTGHGRFHSFDVKMVDRDHPITRTLPTILLHPDELYHDLVNVHGVERRVLATAYSDPETGGTGEDEPMILVRRYGEGRVFHTPLGHVWKGNIPSQASHRDPQFRGLVVRGAEWAATGDVSDERYAPMPLTREERAAGWVPMMEPSRWTEASRSGEGWSINNGLIRSQNAKSALQSIDAYGDFELQFEWKTAIAGRVAGLAYRWDVRDGMASHGHGPDGVVFLDRLLYALTDGWADQKAPELRPGALASTVGAQESPPGIWGEFHTARIVARGKRLEHWLDGALVMSTRLDEDDPRPATGHLALMPMGDEVWVRGMRIRSLKPEVRVDADLARLFTDEDLSKEWFNVGDATYALERGVLVGRAGPKRRQSFLVSKEELHDFELNVDVRIVNTGNSGIQIRSHVRDGRMMGYQVEVDPTDRSWSGGIYGEGKRGWIFDLKDNQDAREAFDRRDWNNYRIRCEGPRIRTWINGVPAADLLDADELSGHLGFQIHGGDDDIEIHWRDARLRRLGAHGWEPAGDAGARAEFGDTDALRVSVKGDAASCQMTFADGTTRTLPLTETKFWRKGGNNRVTFIRSGGRYVVMLDDDHVHRMDGGAAPLTVEIQDATEVGQWSRCVRK